MMKDLLWAESQKLHSSKILWIAGFATLMVGLIVLHRDSLHSMTADILTGQDGL